MSLHFIFMEGIRMLESDYQAGLKERLKKRFPGCMVYKMDPGKGVPQGTPDLLILYGDKWGALECKKNCAEAEKKDGHIKNQKYYVRKMNKMSFASIIYPENEEDVLNDMERSFKNKRRRGSRISECE